jgi:mono/diheme cytochrome c family protein
MAGKTRVIRQPAGLALLVAVLFAMPAWAQDAGRGKLLYDTHCVACHYERIHDRDPSRSLIRSFAGLQAEVANRARLTNQRFSEEDLAEIAEYLNRSHYHLKK